ncbi:hypothetical protein SAMN05216228_10305 [Rhizobium tibeticum]|uniref:Transposase n=1 Tax=Rhizobium tibeticum TaxID=501024 RepID=A0A1H8TQV4_9HYPH|nr:hypothetical protein [Rhizobium tibeticum]SEI16022.1 hypothetical protein RTCCBAU85039_5367 [Rhizobium tibeticum]SEO93206.1 hypothetical protein SAMN05216228_10305 [Rhizobium tibeticum]
MKKTKFHRSADRLHSEAGRKTAVCRKAGISDATFRRKKYAGLMINVAQIDFI